MAIDNEATKENHHSDFIGFVGFRCINGDWRSNNMTEFVVLVNEQNEVLGQADKSTVHTTFDSQNRLLLQQRAKHKKNWPMVWSNSCWGHPLLNESTIDAAKRRCLFELGIEVTDIKEVAPYRYCFEHKGVVENEICLVLVGHYDGAVVINPDEVEAIKWVPWQGWLALTIAHIEVFSPWCIEETLLLR
ncbi:MAG: isopentenyl-diphosphate delta-isomerase [Alteromonadaceae bacterium]